MGLPNNIKYTEDHEWVKIIDNIGYIGITDYAQSELGDIIFIELPSINEEFNSNEVFGTVEAVKTVADLFMPLSSKIIEINDKIDDNPELINLNAENDGWLVKIEIKNIAEIKSLLSLEEYKKIIE